MFTLSVVNHGQMKAATWVPIVMQGMSKVLTAMLWSVGRSSFTSWWALPAQPSARIWPSSSHRPGSWRGSAHHHSTDAPTRVRQTSRVDKKWSWSVFSSQRCWWCSLYHISRVSVPAFGHSISAVVLHPAVPQNSAGQCMTYCIESIHLRLDLIMACTSANPLLAIKKLLLGFTHSEKLAMKSHGHISFWGWTYYMCICWSFAFRYNMYERRIFQ